jgi:hypothetical protein
MVLLASGCLIGAGPTLGITVHGHATVGFEATESVTLVGLDEGTVYDSGRFDGFALFHAYTKADGSLDNGDSPVEDQPKLFLGLAVGGTSGPHANEWMAEAWLMSNSASTIDCNHSAVVATIQAGVRYRHDWEFFISPKVNYRSSQLCFGD